MAEVANAKRAWTALSIALVFVASSACEKLIGADFEQEYVACKTCEQVGWACGDYTDPCGKPPENCGQCGTNEFCNDSHQCECIVETCTERGAQCGAFIDAKCGQVIDCGPCNQGGFCDDGNRCASVPCVPKTCDELGPGEHVTCGVWVDCNAKANCSGCTPNQVCTSDGCCTPKAFAKGQCGDLSDGCGQVQHVGCPDSSQVCQDGACCTPKRKCSEPDLVCGSNPTGCASVLKECAGTCSDGSTCAFSSSYGVWSCGNCLRVCTASAACGLNDDGCGGLIRCFGSCPAGGMCTSDLECCYPRCPATPSSCGDNDDGCGGQVQCPGPCASGTCRATESGFACQ